MRLLYRVYMLLILSVFVMAEPDAHLQAQDDFYMTLKVAWSPSGETLAVSGRTRDHGAIWLFDVDGTLIDTIALGEIAVNISWSHDGTKLAARYEEEGQGRMMLVWDTDALASGAPITTFKEAEYANHGHLIWSPSDRYLAIDTSVSVQIIDVSTGELAAELVDRDRTGNSGVTGAAWTPDEQSVVVAYGARERNQLLQWDVNTAHITRTLLSGDAYAFPEVMRASADDEWLAVSVASSGAVFVLHAPDFEVVRELSFQPGDSNTPYISYLMWSPINTTLTGLAFDGSAYTWDVQTGRLIASDDYTLDSNLVVHGAALSPYGGRLAMATRWVPYSKGTAWPAPPYDPDIAFQTLLNDMVQIVTPAPTFERLTDTAKLCARDAADPDAAQTLDAALPVSEVSLGDFLAAINALPDGAIPPGCRADLLAVAERLQAVE